MLNLHLRVNHVSSHLLSICPCMYSLNHCGLCSSISMSPLLLERKDLDTEHLMQQAWLEPRVTTAISVLSNAACFAMRFTTASCLMVLVHWAPQHLFFKAVSQALVCPGAWSYSPLVLVCVFVGPYELLHGPFLQPVKIPSNSSTDILWIYHQIHPSDFHISFRLSQATLCTVV